MTAAEIHEMGDADRRLTARLRARYYRERSGDGGHSPNA